MAPRIPKPVSLGQREQYDMDQLISRKSTQPCLQASDWVYVGLHAGHIGGLINGFIKTFSYTAAAANNSGGYYIRDELTGRLAFVPGSSSFLLRNYLFPRTNLARQLGLFLFELISSSGSSLSSINSSH